LLSRSRNSSRIASRSAINSGVRHLRDSLLVLAFTQELTQLGRKHPESAAPVFWTAFGWWSALPLAAALLFFLSADGENDRLTKVSGMNRQEGDRSDDWSTSKPADW